MADATVIKPDLDFVKGIIASGGESLKKCYQCATCSVVCNVTPDNKPFPRKEMVWAQWGLKEKFIGNPDVWLCHQCNDCTVYCPRGAKPGEVLGAIRKQSIQQYSAPGFMTRLVNNKKFVPILFLFPAVLFAIVLSAAGTFHIPGGEIVFSKFFSVHLIDPIFAAAFFFGIGVGILGITKFWRDMCQACRNDSIPSGVTTGDLKGSIIETIKEILSHNKFKDCVVSRDRYLAHFLVFYSFIALGITTALAVFYLYILKIESPYSLITPLKLIGNIGAIALFVGINLMVINRFKNAGKVGIGSYFDWLLIFIIYVIVVSGILSELTRLADIAGLAYPIYFIHLVFVFSLFLYLPYSKLAHLFYRTTAICYAKYSKRQ
ncbi:MAG: quinone-interacting membrane-bound oxidoreductase complex subunit QmoC [Thermodesulfovibrionia bacterium]|nr:quinone-interacting membrane-bound oxidoreductase complex subunit QmoC [Thermodesulfovibrionia bacterium]